LSPKSIFAAFSQEIVKAQPKNNKKLSLLWLLRKEKGKEKQKKM